MTSLAESLPQEQQRVRELMADYRSLPGGVGLPAAYLMEQSLQRADTAVMSGDVIAMIQSYNDLKGFTG